MTGPKELLSLRFAIVSPAAAGQASLRRDLLATWIAVTNAGGAVGFTAPAHVDGISDALDEALERVAAGRDAMGALFANDKAVGMGLLVARGTPLCRHWRTVLRVMVHPDYQGQGGGMILMDGLHRLARNLDLDHLQLTIRSGHGLERFYGGMGYTVTGRHPRAIRVTDDDYRDEIMLIASMTES